MKKILRLTEQDLNHIINEVINSLSNNNETVYGRVHYYDAKGRQYRLNRLAQDLRNMGINVIGTDFEDDYDGYVEVDVNLEQAKMLEKKYGSKFYICGRGCNVEERFANGLKIRRMVYPHLQ
jgi:hypothetical protein